jgi:hypothetical protein
MEVKLRLRRTEVSENSGSGNEILGCHGLCILVWYLAILARGKKTYMMTYLPTYLPT